MPSYLFHLDFCILTNLLLLLYLDILFLNFYPYLLSLLFLLFIFYNPFHQYSFSLWNLLLCSFHINPFLSLLFWVRIFTFLSSTVCPFSTVSNWHYVQLTMCLIITIATTVCSFLVMSYYCVQLDLYLIHSTCCVRVTRAHSAHL